MGQVGTGGASEERLLPCPLRSWLQVLWHKLKARSRTVETEDSDIALALPYKLEHFPQMLKISKIIHNVKIALNFGQINDRN